MIIDDQQTSNRAFRTVRQCARECLHRLSRKKRQVVLRFPEKSGRFLSLRCFGRTGGRGRQCVLGKAALPLSGVGRVQQKGRRVLLLLNLPPDLGPREKMEQAESVLSRKLRTEIRRNATFISLVFFFCASAPRRKSPPEEVFLWHPHVSIEYSYWGTADAYLVIPFFHLPCPRAVIDLHNISFGKGAQSWGTYLLGRDLS